MSASVYLPKKGMSLTSGTRNRIGTSKIRISALSIANSSFKDGTRSPSKSKKISDVTAKQEACLVSRRVPKVRTHIARSPVSQRTTLPQMGGGKCYPV